MKYRKKPVVIEAYQLTPLRYNLFSNGAMLPKAPSWIKEALKKKSTELGCLFVSSDINMNYCMRISTLEGNHQVRPNDWIIKGVKGELYPCKPDIFEVTYEAV